MSKLHPGNSTGRRAGQAAAHHHDHGGHGHAHGHGAGHVHGAGNERALALGFILTAGFMVAEVIGGLLSGSLALLADAGHMLTDAAALGLAWLGFRIARKPADGRRSFGYARFEVLAGLLNAVTLFGVVGWIAYEAIQRIQTPQPILAGPMLAIAVLGLFVNVGVFLMLMRADREHINIRGALLHVVGDLLGSVAAIVAAVIIYLTGWTTADPLLSLLVALLIVRSAWTLMGQSLHILLEGAPEGISASALSEDIRAHVPGVHDVHHVHVWSLTSGQNLASLHVELDEGAEHGSVLARVDRRLKEAFGLSHTTIQIEEAGWCLDDEPCGPNLDEPQA